MVEHCNNYSGSLAAPGSATDLLHDLQPVIYPWEVRPASVGHHKGIKAVTSFVASLWWCRIK